MRRAHATHTTTTRTRKPSLMARLRAKTTPHYSARTHYATTTTVAPHTSRHSRRTHVTTTAPTPVHHHQRKPSMGDKISGAMLKLKGSLTRRPGQKAAGTRRMRGTDGRGARRFY